MQNKHGPLIAKRRTSRGGIPDRFVPGVTDGFSNDDVSRLRDGLPLHVILAPSILKFGLLEFGAVAYLEFGRSNEFTESSMSWTLTTFS